VNKIGGDRSVRNQATNSLASFTEPGHEPGAVMSELQQKFLFAATMSDVPEAAGKGMPIGSCHPPPLGSMTASVPWPQFCPQKSTYSLFLTGNFDLFGINFDELT
jgi:hypothetical protein